MKMHLPCSNLKSRKPQTPYLILALHFALFKAVQISFLWSNPPVSSSRSILES